MKKKTSRKRFKKRILKYAVILMPLCIGIAVFCLCLPLIGNLHSAFHTQDHTAGKTKVELNAKTLSITRLDVTDTLQAKFSASNTGKKPAISWLSSDTNVAVVDKDGNVTSVNPGKCIVSAVIKGKTAASCDVTVSLPTSNDPSYKIPVLMYHSIEYEKNNILRVPEEDFAKEMDWLDSNGYTVLSINELYNYVSSKTPFPEKAVALTFDDGYNDNYTNAYPILKQHHFHATVFMISSFIGKDGYLTSDQLLEMSRNGVDIESHTVTHRDLDTLSYDIQLEELKDSKSALENLLGKKADFLAFPSGKYNADTLKIEKEAGYKMCFKMKGGAGSLQDSIYEFPRAFVGNDLRKFILVAQGKLKSADV